MRPTLTLLLFWVISILSHGQEARFKIMSDSMETCDHLSWAQSTIFLHLDLTSAFLSFEGVTSTLLEIHSLNGIKEHAEGRIFEWTAICPSSMMYEIKWYESKDLFHSLVIKTDDCILNLTLLVLE